MQVYDSLIDLVGNTPLVRLHFGADGVTALGLWVGAPCALIRNTRLTTSVSARLFPISH